MYMYIYRNTKLELKLQLPPTEIFSRTLTLRAILLITVQCTVMLTEKNLVQLLLPRYHPRLLNNDLQSLFPPSAVLMACPMSFKNWQ